MSRERLHIDKFIKKELENGALLGKDIIERYENDPNNKRPVKGNHTYSGAFDKLLKDNVIFILDYDGGEKRNQNIGYYNLIFDILKSQAFEIRRLITQLSINSDINAYVKLNKLFNDKVRLIEKENVNTWRLLKTKVELRNPTEEELLFYEASLEACKKHNELSETDLEAAMDYDFFLIDDIVENLRSLTPEIISKHNNINIRVVDYPNYDPDDPDDFYHVPKTLIGKKYSFDAETSEEELLNEIGLYEPTRRDNNEIRSIFDKVLYYINVHPREKEILIENFSLGLSNQEGSETALDELVYNATEGKEKLIMEDPLT